MTIEKLCNNYTGRKIELWDWYDAPHSLVNGLQGELQSFLDQTYIKIDGLIKEAEASECLLSKSEYIRECKRYFMENK